jgi:hypothetical protein
LLRGNEVGDSSGGQSNVDAFLKMFELPKQTKLVKAMAEAIGGS